MDMVLNFYQQYHQFKN